MGIKRIGELLSKLISYTRKRIVKKLISMAMFLTALAVLSWSAKAQENPESVVTNLYKADKAKAVSDTGFSYKK